MADRIFCKVALSVGRYSMFNSLQKKQAARTGGLLLPHLVTGAVTLAAPICRKESFYNAAVLPWVGDDLRPSGDIPRLF